MRPIDVRPENVTSVKLMGGQNGAYSAQTGLSTINGKLTVGNGSLVADRVVIRCPAWRVV